MTGIGGLACLVLLLIVIAIGYFIVTSSKKVSNASPVGAEKKGNKFWKRWLAHFVIAFILLAFWSVCAALFYLAIVWVMLQNPNLESSAEVNNEVKSVARRVYTWLFISSLFTVPFFLILVIYLYSRNTTNSQYVLIALAPLLLHTPLLLGMTSKSIFVYRHSQQGILLIAIRACVAALALGIGDYPEDGIWLFLLGNGSLWLFGSIWGWVQVNRGDCWWMKQREGIFDTQKPTAYPGMVPGENLSPEKNLEYSRWYLKNGRKSTSKEYALEAFRHGDVEMRQKAVRILDDLNEVEFF